MTRPELKPIFGDQTEAIERYVDILIDRGIAWGLLGPREAAVIWQRHILNSVAARSLLPADSTAVDVGSGAGLPGIPLALSRPDVQLVLLEPLLRRSTFLQGVVDELGLAPRVQVVRARAEDHDRRYDSVLARAVAPLGKLVGWCNPLRSAEGQVLAIKGASAAREVTDAGPVLDELGLDAEVLLLGEPEWPETATVVRVLPTGSTGA
ncbi:16S rRNA (guanine(527)-N(7))-methyltransferase RsmG [Microlunatus speluncae]|uniref:16S rRNA (guanine(527)-N(7))-methyltransferase RsmG n=1 Tax=Microlunatus speluncae TaxID=2594267 RepID=UPI0012666651|nr:16S rRNA (guanine(527)-N(7))-methyltransferase RsmG [Microlunatus speluncae]